MSAWARRLPAVVPRREAIGIHNHLTATNPGSLQRETDMAGATAKALEDFAADLSE